MLKKSKAFTITELVIVIAVIAILAAVMIPTFSGVIESAKVSTDTANAGILSTELKVALMNNEETITEANAHRLLKEEFAAGKSGGIVPQSAGYGYHFVYNFNNGTIEVKHISEITKSATQSLNVGNGGVDLSNWGNVPETCFLNNGYFLLDTAGSALAEVVNNIYTVASASDLTAIATSVVNNLTKDYAAAGQHIKAYLDTVVFIGNGADFTTAADRSDVKNVVFVSQVEQITSVVNTVGESAVKQSVADYDNPVATLSSGTVVEIPSSVKEISRNALVFAVSGEDSAQHNEQSIRLHFAAGIDQVVQGLDIGFTNCEFTFGDDKMIYHLSDDGTQILDEANEVVETLESQYPVTDFDIRIVGVDSEDVLSVALDSFTDGIGSYQFEAVNFMSGDKPFASNTSVRWKVASDTSSSASITQDGLLTFTKPGEIVVKATSQENAEVSAIYTVRVGGVINTSGIEFTGIDGNLQIVDAVTSKITMINGQPAVINYTVTVNTNFEIEGIDKSYTVTSSAENAVVNQDGTISVNGAGNFTITLTFNSYPDIVVTHNFIVEEKLQSFECIAQELPNIGRYLYKVGNLNAFDITRLWQFTGLHKDEGLNDSDIEISYNFINAKDNQTLDSTWYTLEGNMLQFIDFQGVVRIEITATADGVELNQIVVPLEVLDGYNVTTETELFNTTNNSYNKMILNDITLTQYSSNSTYVVNGETLYGNGYTLDGSAINSEGVAMKWNALVSVNDAVVDNVRIIGDTFPEIATYDKPYAGYTLYLAGSYCEVYNSYSYGSRAAVYVSADSYIYNTVFEGGVMANIIPACYNLILEDVVTIQNVDSDSLPDEITEENANQLGVGLGIFVDQGIANVIKITLKGDFRQYNWVDTALVEKIDSTYKPIADKILNDADEFKHVINGNTYVNTGIVFYDKIEEDKLAEKVVDQRSNKDTLPYTTRNYTAYLPIYGEVSGTVYSLFNNNDAITAGNIVNSTTDNRFDSNSYNQPRTSVQTKAVVDIELDESYSVFNTVVNGKTLTVELSAQNGKFTLLPSMFVATHYNTNLNNIKLLNSEGVSVDSIDYTVGNKGVNTFSIQVTSSQNFDIQGNWVDQPLVYTYQYELKVELGEYSDATIAVTGDQEHFYHRVGFTIIFKDYYDYHTVANIFQGLTVTDYNENGERVVVFNGDTYDWNANGEKLPQGFEIKSFDGGQMNNDHLWEFVLRDNKLYIQSAYASDNKCSEKMTVVLSYKGFNGREVTIELSYNFTSSTAHQHW
ncbi:MAG TPA: pilin [Candidatus Limihabitans stercoravium]|nr:pilin [Candidatus Limihabitans stercoravium]